MRPIALVAAVCALALAATAVAEDGMVFSVGHVDVIDIALEDGMLEMGIHAHDLDVEFEPEEVVLFAKPESRTRVPSDPQFSFLGSPGANVWILPQVQQPRILWPGFATEEIDMGALAGDTVELRLVGEAGPGTMIVYSTDAFGTPMVQLNSRSGPYMIPLPVGSHAHSNWAFTATGRYELTFEASGRLAGSGAMISTGNVTYVFDVGTLMVEAEEEPAEISRALRSIYQAPNGPCSPAWQDAFREEHLTDPADGDCLDRVWSLDFQRTNGRPPADDDWAFHFFYTQIEGEEEEEE
jgi:surface-anchored protein